MTNFCRPTALLCTDYCECSDDALCLRCVLPAAEGTDGRYALDPLAGASSHTV